MNVQRANYFRENLRVAMKLRGYSQRAFADQVGISLSHLNQILQGTVMPGLDLCDRLADNVGFSLEDLLLPPDKFETFESVPA